MLINSEMFITTVVACELFWITSYKVAGGQDEYAPFLRSPKLFTTDSNYLSKLIQDVLMNKTDTIFLNEGDVNVDNLDLDCKITHLKGTLNKEIFTDAYNTDAINNLLLNKTDNIILYGVYNNSDEFNGLNCRLSNTFEFANNVNKTTAKSTAKPRAKPTAKKTTPIKSTTKPNPYKNGQHHSDKVFHAGKNEVVLFKSLQIADTCNMTMAFFIVFILAFVNEFLKPCTAYLCCSDISKDPEIETSNRQCGGISKTSDDCECYKSCLDRFYRFLFRLCRYILQVFISYILMMIIMTMNIWLFFAVILGATAGYACYSSTCRKSLFISDCSNPCC